MESKYEVPLRTPPELECHKAVTAGLLGRSKLVELLRALQHSTVGARDERLESKIVY
jgi:hypothetical protein